ncbi:MAG: hypothetical protein H5U10_17380 [Desulfacinum sp.]|nr:hypothetical protein [Desulfacinum sp.]
MRGFRLLAANPFVSLSLCCAFLLLGCATTDPEQAQQQVGGAVVGALLGGAVGALTSRDAKGALVGAAAGAALGFAAVKLAQYQANRVRTAEQDAKIYGLTPLTDTPLVKINDISCSSPMVTKTDPVQFHADYSLSVPKSFQNVAVQETYIFKDKDGKVVANLGTQQKNLEPGGYEVRGKLLLPENTLPGEYQLELQIKAGTSYDVSAARFQVKG